MHLDEAERDKHQAVVRNMGNLLDDLGDGSPVELVTHGPGVALCLADSPVADGLRRLMDRGVVVTACENTMQSLDIDRSQLAPGVVTVPAGIGELVRRQRQGWAYVRP